MSENQAPPPEEAVPDPPSDAEPTGKDAGRNLQEWNTDFDSLVYRPVGSATGRVLNTGVQPPSIYNTDLEAVSCDCAYMNKSEDAHPRGDRVCKHLAKAMLAHPSFVEVPELLTRDLSALVDRAAQATRAVENSRDVAQAKASAEASSQSAQETTDDSDGETNWLAEFDVRMNKIGVDPANIDRWIDDQFGSLQFEPDGYLEEDEYGAFMDWCAPGDQNGINWDKENSRNYIKEDDLPEVLG